MSDKVIEAHVYDFLAEKCADINDAEANFGEEDPEHSALFGAELHQHIYQKFDEKNYWFGIRVGNGESTLAPNPGQTEMEEFDGNLTLVAFARIKKADNSDVEDARSKAFAVAKAVAQLFIDNPTIGGRVNYLKVDRCPRGFDEWATKLYAVCNMPLTINQ